MEKKEISIIFILAVLVTGTSWFYAPDSVCGFRGDCNRGINPTIYHGLPLRFIERSLYSQSKINILNLLFDLIFWFLIFIGGSIALKKLKR
ncbi:hypothetical protein HYW19_00320 [Candidatus Woesearchaeota archaeon]|nr:hypothetical protein [Candidatus Woesearchaeota archaeon]